MKLFKSRLYYLLLLFLPFMVISCSDDEDPAPNVKGGDFLNGGNWNVTQVILEFTTDGTNWVESYPTVGYDMTYGVDGAATWITSATFHAQVANYFQTSQDPLFLQNGTYTGEWSWREETNLPTTFDVDNYNYGYIDLGSDYVLSTINNTAGDSMQVTHIGPQNPDSSQYRVHFLLLK